MGWSDAKWVINSINSELTSQMTTLTSLLTEFVFSSSSTTYFTTSNNTMYGIAFNTDIGITLTMGYSGTADFVANCALSGSALNTTFHVYVDGVDAGGSANLTTSAADRTVSNVAFNKGSIITFQFNRSGTSSQTVTLSTNGIKVNADLTSLIQYTADTTAVVQS